MCQRKWQRRSHGTLSSWVSLVQRFIGVRRLTKTYANSKGVNLVYVCTDWMSHVPIAIHAMEQGRSVAVEVPAALTLKDIWALIDTAEQTDSTV